MVGSKPKLPRIVLEPTMTPKEIMHRWSAYLQHLLPTTHLYQVVALATFSWALAQGRHCHLSRMCAYVPGAAHRESVLRRLKRLLHNPRLDVEAVCDEMAAWLSRWNSQSAQLILLLDETPHHNHWRVLKVSVAYRRRALPLVWRTDALAKRPHKERVTQVLEQAARLTQRYCPNAQVTLLADRGLCWPQIIDLCHANGWHFVLRAQNQIRFVPTGACPKQSGPVGALVTRPGQFFCGQGRAFAHAGWRCVSVVVCWRRESQAPWIVISDLAPTLHLVRLYAKRMWQEQSFRDEKSHGFCWHESHLQSAQTVHRLLLLIALAHLWLLSLGTRARSPEWQKRLGLCAPWATRRRSLFAHGWQFWLFCLQNQLRLPCDILFSPR